MKVGRNLWWMTPLALLLTLSLCSGPVKKIFTPHGGFEMEPAATQSAPKVFVMEEVHFLQHEAGEPVIEVVASRVSSSNMDTGIDLENVKASFLRPSSTALQVNSFEARYEITQRILTLMGEVSVITPEGYSLEGDVLRYLEKYGKLKTAAEMTFRGPGITVSGGGFFYDVWTGDFRMGGQSRVVCDFVSEKGA